MTDKAKQHTVRLPATYHNWICNLAEHEGISFNQALNMTIAMAMTFEVLASQEEYPVVKTAIDKVAYEASGDLDKGSVSPFHDPDWQAGLREKYPRVKGFRNRPKKGCG